MLTVDRTQTQFVLDGVAIGPSVDGSNLANSLATAITPMPGDGQWSFLEVKDRHINVFVTLLKGVVHSGYFWIAVPSAGWDDYERAEQQRRSEHERVMQQLFGALSFDDGRMRVRLIRDPRSGLEQIAFSMVEARGGARD